MARHLFSRRRFALLAAAGAANAAQAKSPIPVGLQQTAVGRNIQQDLAGTLRAIAKMGYELIEFSANTFMTWTPEKAREVRAMLDDLNLACRSTHNEIVSFGAELSKAIELNQILGSRTLVSVRGPSSVAAGRRGGGPAVPPPGVDAWKRFSETLSSAAERIRQAKMSLGFHNHEVEFQSVEGTRPIDILAANADITAFHLNVGLCLRGGGDPIALVQQCRGRIQTLLIQDFQGKARWKELFAAAEDAAGLEFYLIQRTDGLFLVERQGDNLLDFAEKDLQHFRTLHG
jgi:sugar phosphate isomerase/epimerase